MSMHTCDFEYKQTYSLQIFQ